LAQDLKYGDAWVLRRRRMHGSDIVLSDCGNCASSWNNNARWSANIAATKIESVKTATTPRHEQFALGVPWSDEANARTPNCERSANRTSVNGALDRCSDAPRNADRPRLSRALELLP
jgi:hypothetical protein